MGNGTNGSDDSSADGVSPYAENSTVQHSWNGSVDPSVTIVEAVSAATGRTVTDLPPLQRSVDPDALDTLLTHGEPSQVAVSFRYAGTVVDVSDNGTIDVYVDDDTECE